MRILNAEPNEYSPKARAILKKLGALTEEHCDRSRLMELVPDVDVLIVRLGHRVDEELIKLAKSLKIIVTATTGLNHIDLKAAGRHNIEVLSLKDERQFLDTLTATAELTWALLLGVIRKLPYAHQHIKEGGWDRDRFRGNQLKNKILGIIGYGRLGSIVAEYGHVFQMRILACDPYVTNYPNWVERVELSELLQCSDVISLHVCLDDSTQCLLDREAFSMIKKGVILINTSRGELVDENAMIDALKDGSLAGAGLDVLNDEIQQHQDWPINNPVWQYAKHHENVILTPHVGGATQESMEATEIFMARKLERYLS